MKKRKLYMFFFIVAVVAIAVALQLSSDSHTEKKLIGVMLSGSETVTQNKDLAAETFIKENFPAIKRVYEIDGKPAAFVTETIGYKGKIMILSVLDPDKGVLMGVKVLSHEDTPEYADHIKKKWFLKRFENLPVAHYLKLVILEKEKPEEIIQVTGATVTSQGVLNGVNAAIGGWQYLVNDVKMKSVPKAVSQEIWNTDENSFAVNWEGGSRRITLEDVKAYPQETVEATLMKTTGTKTKIKVQGPLLSTVLKAEGLDLKNYQGIGITGRDGYYTMVDQEKLKGPVILGWKFDGKEIGPEEKPIRVCLPEEMGPYWVKLVSNIDLYDEVAPKDLEAVHMFDALTRDIDPYYYEYYGSKDKSIAVGKILAKFEAVDHKGFFTMCAVDGLEKNETISLVRDRYFIKIEGKNAPMNIAPNFKLGMNVKNMSHFSTTKDCVVFPWKIIDLCRTKEIDGKQGMLLEDVLVTAGLSWKPENSFQMIDTSQHVSDLMASEVGNCYLVYGDGVVTLYKNGEVMTKDLLTIRKVSK